MVWILIVFSFFSLPNNVEFKSVINKYFNLKKLDSLTRNTAFIDSKRHWPANYTKAESVHVSCRPAHPCITLNKTLEKMELLTLYRFHSMFIIFSRTQVGDDINVSELLALPDNTATTTLASGASWVGRAQKINVLMTRLKVLHRYGTIIFGLP